MRKVSDLVGEGFIWGVGITRPREGRERQAALYITTLLVSTIAFAVAFFFFLKSHIF